MEKDDSDNMIYLNLQKAFDLVSHRRISKCVLMNKGMKK